MKELSFTRKEMSFIMKLLELLFPWNLSCLLCSSEEVSPQDGLCDHCRSKLPYADEYCCQHCGREIEIIGLCADCMQTPPHFDKAFAPFLYDDKIKDLIHGLKYSNKQYLAAPLAHFMAAHFPAEIRNQCTCIAPVPLFPQRLKERGYNQSALLAKELSSHLALPFEESLLERRRATPAQAKMTREERLKNVKNAFSARDAAKGQCVLLIDDVLTTGATADACAQALKKAGAAKVFVCTAATGNKKR